MLAADVEPGHEAVRDLVRVIAAMGGAALPIATKDAPEGAAAQLHLGATDLAQEAGLLPDDLPLNGYRIVSAESGTRLSIVAPAMLGLSHGIYDLLSNELGVSWGMADLLFEEIPKRRTVTVEAIDRVERPSYPFRVFSGNNSTWLRRNRVDVGSDKEGHPPLYGHGHNLFRVFPPSKYGDRPEYYRMRDGKRDVPDTDAHTDIQPCFTNPDVLRITVDTVREFFDEHAAAPTFSLCANDGSNYCECPSCEELNSGMGEFRGRKMHSDSYFSYIEAVATQLLDSHPDRYVSAYAYWMTELPPRDIRKLPRNVVVYLTQDSSQYFDEAYEQRDREMLERWSDAAHNLAVYDYHGLGWFMPRYYPSIVARTLPYLPTVGVKGFYCETYPHWAHVGPQLYMTTRLLWDLSLDARTVLDEWYESMFAEAAPEMKAFYESLEEPWLDPNWGEYRREGKFFEGRNNIHLQLQCPLRYFERSLGLVEAADAVAQTPRVKERIAYVHRAHRLSCLLSTAYHTAHVLKADTEALEGLAAGIVAMVDEAMALYHAAIDADPNYPATYYAGGRPYRLLNWWKRDIAECLEAVLADRDDVRERLMTGSATLAAMMALTEDDTKR